MSISSRVRARAPLLLLILALAAACFAESSQSLWTDESETVIIVLPATLHGAVQAFYNDHTSCMQMPVYFAYLWVWVRLFGSTELWLRISNVPWFFVGFFAIFHFLRRRPGLRNVTLLVFCIHPFVLYYLNEVRSYAMDLAGALLVAGAIFEAMDRPGELLPASWWWYYATGVFILCGATIVGAPWAFAITLLLISLSNVRRSLPRALVPALIYLPLMTLMGLYYLWTLKENVRNAPGATTLPTALSVFYELFGFVGLGPGRVDMRVNSVSSVRPFLAPLALLGVPLAYGLFVAARRRFGLKPGQLIPILLITAVVSGLTFGLGILRHSRMLARHFTPLFPFILMAEVCALLFLWKSGRAIGRAAATLIVVALLCSSVEVRLAFRHSKDDCRSAAAAARQALAQGKTVWWAAETAGAQYYHLPFTHAEMPGSVWVLDGAPAHFTSPPDEIFFSKPDLFDRPGTLAAFIAAHHYFPVARWQSFTLWQKPPA